MAAEVALLKKLVKDELLKPRYRSDDPAMVVEAVMHEQGIASRLSNLLYQHRRSLEAAPKTMAEQSRVLQPPGGPADGKGACGSAPRSADQELDVIAQLQARWRKHVEASLRSLCSELGMPLMWPSASAPCGKPAARGGRAVRMRGVYEPEEMLEVIATTGHPNASTNALLGFGLVLVQLRTPTLAELVERLGDLNASVRQAGVDDELRGWFREERHHMARRVLADGYTPVLFRFLRCGAPVGLRAPLWARALDLEPGGGEAHYAALVAEVGRVAQVTDGAVCRDVLSPWNEEEVFLFREVVGMTIACFLRDPEVPKLAAVPGMAVAATSPTTGHRYAFPPCGVLPVRGLASLAFPLCFCYSDPPQLYFVFRALWCRYWCKLHTLSGRQGTLLPLLRQFELLLQQLHPSLYLHFSKLDLHPTKLAFQWVQFAFASYLPVAQLLLFWDRIIGFDTLELIPLLAVAIFLFRSADLMRAQHADAALLLLSDSSQLQVIPLLQTILHSPSSLIQPSAPHTEQKREHARRA